MPQPHGSESLWPRQKSSPPANARMIYAYFGSKEGLFKAVIEQAVLQMQDAVTRNVDTLGPPSARGSLSPSASPASSQSSG